MGGLAGQQVASRWLKPLFHVVHTSCGAAYIYFEFVMEAIAQDEVVSHGKPLGLHRVVLTIIKPRIIGCSIKKPRLVRGLRRSQLQVARAKTGQVRD